MSESRQRFTGRVFLGLLGLVLLWLLFVTLPLFTSYLQISTMDPRWMTPADLTWQRIVFNLLSKPGFRLMLVGGVWLLMRLVWWGAAGLRITKKPRLRLPMRRSSFSLEWAIDGARRTSLMEYGRFVGVI